MTRVRIGRLYVRREAPHSVARVVEHGAGKVTYKVGETWITVGKQSFKEMYRRKKNK
jgi:hypothetical protein